jgi:hypothetical protein
MTLLVISPDYASHLLPLATLATSWRDAGERVVVASGPATAAITAEFGFERTDLRLGRGSNPGVIRADAQVRGEDDALRGFFAATERGMVETLLYQANARSADLLWDPVATARRVLAVVQEVRPDHVIVDHLAFSARLALLAGGVPHGDVVLGHPSALPVGGEVYGYPTAWPAVFDPEPDALAALLRRCEQVRDAFTTEWNTALETLAPQANPAHDAFAEHSDVLLLNYPEQLHDPQRSALLPPHAFLGSAVRRQDVPPDIERWLDADPGRPIVYVSFGSFLSVRADVLARVAAALTGLPVRVALAIGWSESSCRRSRCSTGPHWRSRTGATTASPSRCWPACRCWCCRSPRTSSPAPPRSKRRASGACSIPTSPRSMRSGGRPMRCSGARPPAWQPIWAQRCETSRAGNWPSRR